DYALAAEELEAALMADGARRDVRELVADVLYDRALVAERERRLAQRDELVERFLLFDDSGDRRRRWDAPARVNISSTPRARVTIERWLDDGRGGRKLAPPLEL